MFTRFLTQFGPISRATSIPIPIELEMESPILDIHIHFMGKECEFQFLDLDSTLEPKLTFEPKDDFRS